MELALAKQLIDQTTNEEFEPTKYKDTVRERVLETIQRKIEGQDITAADVAPDSGGKIIDLMDALRASLAATAESEKEAAKAPKKGRKAS
jgi:DNA end-binding protein Ku